MISRIPFPRLTNQNHRVTSPATPNYNCIAWSADDTQRWWQPGIHWPIEAQPDDYGLGLLVETFRSLGYEECEDEVPEPGYEKVALYGGMLIYTHAARQLANGKWTSKLGRAENIEHDSPDALARGVYAEVHEFMRRAIPLS